MKVSLNSILQLNAFYKTTGNVAAIGLDKLVEKIGAQLGAVDEVIDIGSKYQGIVVAKVVSCDKHPNADKLSLCTIDVGKEKPVQVVCGAPNVAAGQTVAWIPPGTAVPESVGKEPFVIEAREIRGVVSHGMIASPKELALGDSHEGILVLDDWYKPGQDFAEAMGLKGDVVLDIENKMFTHRPDCFGYLGVARELAGIQGMAFRRPDWYVLKPPLPEPNGQPLGLTVKNEVPKLVPRFSAIVMNAAKVGPSPAWLVIELAKLGQKPINNVVDLTNYMMLLTGQPLHAYDYDKVKALSGGGEATLRVRAARKGEKLALLNGKTVELSPEDIVIATDRQAIGLGGVMGGRETEVDENTTNIILEAANFDMYTVRRTSMTHGLFTDAVTRFSKGPSRLQTLPALAKMATATTDLTGARLAGELIDVGAEPDLLPAVKVSADFINARLGERLPAADMKQLLENVEFAVHLSGQQLTVHPPFWRTDVEIPEDVVEEVGRLYGYDHLPLELPRRDLTPPPRDPLLAAKASVRQRLSKAGANEVLTYSFVHGDLIGKVGQDAKQAFRVANALSPDLQYYRLSLLPSLLEKVHPNVKAGHDNFALFELGKAHVLGEPDAADPGLPKEVNALGFIYSSKKVTAAPYYVARKYLMDLLSGFQAQDLVALEPLAGADLYKNPWLEQMVAPFEPKRSAVLRDSQGLVWGVVGEFRRGVRQALKLPDGTAGFEIDPLLLLQTDQASSYLPLSRFPSVKQDITLKVAAELPYAKLAELIESQLATSGLLTSLEPLGIYQPDKAKAHKNVSFRITAASYERTLTDAEVNKLLDEVAAAAKRQLKAERV